MIIRFLTLLDTILFKSGTDFKGWFVNWYKMSYNPLMNAGKKIKCTLMLGEYLTRSVDNDINCLHEVLKRKRLVFKKWRIEFN